MGIAIGLSTLSNGVVTILLAFLGLVVVERKKTPRVFIPLGLASLAGLAVS